MAKFNLTWDNSSIQGNANVTSQEANYQSKLVPGWINTGFTNYANPIAVNHNISTSPDLSDNIIYQFKVNSICSLGGPIPNIGGVSEGIHFACITPGLANTGTTATISVSLAGTSITQVRFTLRRSPTPPAQPSTSDPIIMAPTVVARSGSNIATITASTGLAYSTSYYWEVELFATLVNGGVSSGVWGPTPTCKTTFITNDPPTCAAVTDLDVSSVGA